MRFVALVHIGVLAAGMAFAADRHEQSNGLQDKEDNVMNEASGNPQAGKDKFRIQLTFNDKKIVVSIHDNPTSRDFLRQLPITLKLSDYAGTEKVAYLARELSTENAPLGYDPSAGDITYYAPWGNLAIFYKDFRYSKGLIPLGIIESGLEALADLPDDVTVNLERIERK